MAYQNFSEIFCVQSLWILKNTSQTKKSRKNTKKYFCPHFCMESAHCAKFPRFQLANCSDLETFRCKVFVFVWWKIVSFDGSEIIKRRNLEKSAHSQNCWPIVADNEQLQKKQWWKPTRNFLVQFGSLENEQNISNRKCFTAQWGI